jgi:hypothetical protein
MNLEELLEQIREVYYDAFQEAIAERRREGGPDLILEPVLLDEEGEPVREGLLNLPLRGDLFVVHGEELDGCSVDSTSMLDFEPFSFTVEDEHVPTFTLSPFVWDSVEMTLGGLDEEATDWSPLTSWFLAWFADDEDRKEGDLAHVVHGLSDPEMTADGLRLTIDLGSAPVGAFEDLLAAVHMLGATTCHFGSTNVAEPDEDDIEEDV